MSFQVALDLVQMMHAINLAWSDPQLAAAGQSTRHLSDQIIMVFIITRSDKSDFWHQAQTASSTMDHGAVLCIDSV